MIRVATLASIALTALALSACGLGRDHVAELAAAKCVVPVTTKVATQQPLYKIVVTKLKPDRRLVTGLVMDKAGVSHDFECVVSPDPSDTLRGLRIDSLTVFT